MTMPEQVEMRWSVQRVCGAVALAGIALMSACSQSDDDDPLASLAEEAEPAPWDIRAGVEILTLEGGEPGQALTLYDEAGDALITLTADGEGRAHFAYVVDNDIEMGDLDSTLAAAFDAGAMSGESIAPGDYLVRADDVDPPLVSERTTVLARDDHPDPALYDDQELVGAELDVLGQPVEGAELDDGYHYVEMRDGVSLSAMVRFPDRRLYGDGPWPTVIELSGYGPSNPGAEEPGARLARSLGYATVSVNLRGTGCSGGVFDTFNPAQMADGYDLVEVVSRQSWVLNNQVGMVGLSYSGITQLYTAATGPPGLAAVTPQSVITDPWLQQWPGGIYNDGFTREWLEEQERQSAPGGSGWVDGRIAEGDEQCRDNVAEHELNIDFAGLGRAVTMRVPSVEDRDLRELVRDVDVPVFLTGAFQDEQTGPQFGALLARFDNAPLLRASLWNGRHPDGYTTMNVMELYEFLELYVARRVPQFPEVLRDVVAGELAGNFGFDEGDLPPNRLADEFGDDYAAALAHYEAELPVRVVFGSGLAGAEVGAPGAAAEARAAAWPPADAVVTSWYLTPDGDLSDDIPDADTAAEHSFAFDPEAGKVDVLDGGYDMLGGVWDFDWSEFPEGRSLSYETGPLDDHMVVAGPGYVELWVGADAADADVQVSISEVREDGFEHLVQSGVLRLGHRAEDDARSTELDVVHHFTADAYEPLPDDELVPARVPLPAMGHVFGEGSSLRVTVSSPGRHYARWTFEPSPELDEDTTYRVGVGEDTPSRLVLPVWGVDVEGYPDEVPCPGLRGVPCRAG